MNRIKKLFKRMIGRGAHKLRSYTGAASNRLLADWITGPTSADAEIYGDIAKARERARDLERNEPFVQKYLFELENNVVGDSGFLLRSEPKDMVTGRLDELAKQVIEKAWKEFNEAGNYTVRKNLSGAAADRLILRAIARDGEALVRIVRGYDNEHSFSLQLLEPDQMDHHYNGRWEGREIRMGVELSNDWKLPVAYWIDQEHPGDLYAFVVSGGRKRVRIPANEILHLHKQDRAGQTRGISWLVNSMQYLRMLGGYEEAVLVNARTAAARMGFFTSQNGEDYGPTDPENPDDPLTMEVEPGMLEQLPRGMSFTPWDPKQPNDNFSEFRKAILRRVAGGWAISYNTLANDLEGVNYTSLRDGKLTERDGYKLLQKWFIDVYKRPVFLAWLEHSLDLGLLKTPGGKPLPFQKFPKFRDHAFYPRRWQWVDPRKDAEATRILRANNWTSDSDVMADMGKELGTTYDQIAADKKAAKDKGVDNSAPSEESKDDV